MRFAQLQREAERRYAGAGPDRARGRGRGHAPGQPTARRVLALQRSAGNRAVTALLQRQEAGEADAGPLTAQQVTAAIRFHTAQPQRYTAEIMNEIQAAVGVEQTGRADEATVQAIARFQETDGASDPALRVDGKAGPRTLPRMFPNGLNAAGEGQAFGEEAQTGVIDHWQELTPQQRAAELVRLVNVHLEAAGVPPVIPNPSETGVAAGEFDFATWQMNIGLPALSVAQPTRDQAAQIIETIYHEARHAEEWFRIAQLRALQRRRRAVTGAAEDARIAQAIATEMDIQRRIADLAVAAPLTAGSMQALIAQGWFDSVYGSGSAHREAVLTEVLSAAAARNRARDRATANPRRRTRLRSSGRSAGSSGRTTTIATCPRRTTRGRPGR